MSAPLSPQGYTPGHPWHYHLGGAVPSPREIRAAVRLSGYLGYREPEIRSAAALAEPARTRALDAIRRDVCNMSATACAPISRVTARSRGHCTPNDVPQLVNP